MPNIDDDIFEQAFENVGIETDKTDIERSMTEAGMSVNTPRKKSTGRSVFTGLSEANRELAVKLRVVPRAYKDAAFNEEAIKNNIKYQYIKTGKIFMVHKLNEYITVCNNILMALRSGHLPDRSYIIGAPNGFGKTSFVNEAIITMVSVGFTAVPYISLWELAQLRVENETRLLRPYKKYRVEDAENSDVVFYDEKEQRLDIAKKPTIITGEFSFSEYINADCLFVSLTDVMSKDIESHMLQQLLHIRGAKALPTIVLTYNSLVPYEKDYTLKELVWDEIMQHNPNKASYDRLTHVSCYKNKNTTIGRDETLDKDSGIIS